MKKFLIVVGAIAVIGAGGWYLWRTQAAPATAAFAGRAWFVQASALPDPATLAAHLVKPEFSLPAYKGVSLTYRPWDHQLRQAIIVVQPKALVSVAPEQGFLHQRTPLDTLGVDLPETTCKFK